ncbi:MAG: type 4a pilus biogenesis protein PilO [Patescibacteria group bacterium]
MKDQGVRFWSRYTREYLYEPAKKASLTTFLIGAYITSLYILGIGPLLKKIDVKKSMLSEREKTIALTDERLKNIKSLKPLYREAEQEVLELNESIPNNEGLSNFIENIFFTTSNNEFRIVYLSPNSILGEDNLITTNITLHLEGNPNNILKLVKDLEGSTRFIGIKSFNINKDTNTLYDEGKVFMIISIYAIKDQAL